MNKDTSPYYPGRARWYSRFFYLGLAARQRLALDRIRLPKEITIGGVILGFLIPVWRFTFAARAFGEG